jgi:hypothetical protein
MPDIEHAIQIAARPQAIYPLVATGAGFRDWWAADVTETPGAAELGFFNRTTIYKLKLTVSEKPSRAEWAVESGKEWAGTKIVFSLEAHDKSTMLRFTHAGWAASTEYFTSCNTTWGELMFRLKAAAEGKSRGPLFGTDDLAY